MDSNPPDKSSRPAHPPARPWVIHGRITDFIIFLIRVSGGPRVLSFLSGGYPPARPLLFKEKKNPNPHFPRSPSLILFSLLPLPANQNSTPQRLQAAMPQHPPRRSTATPPHITSISTATHHSLFWFWVFAEELVARSSENSPDLVRSRRIWWDLARSLAESPSPPPRRHHLIWVCFFFFFFDRLIG